LFDALLGYYADVQMFLGIPFFLTKAKEKLFFLHKPIFYEVLIQVFLI